MIFSSPEHNLLKGSFYGGDVSVVRHQQFFEYLLLPNHRANLDQTWQECSLGGPLQKFSQNLIPSKTWVAMATK